MACPLYPRKRTFRAVIAMSAFTPESRGMSVLICGATHSSKRTHRGYFAKSQCCGSAIKNQMAASHVATSTTMTAQRMILPHMKRIITRKRPATDGRRHGPLLPQQIAMVNDLPSFINTPCCISSVVRWCNTGSKSGHWPNFIRSLVSVREQGWRHGEDKRFGRRCIAVFP
jgi:hypothetical protein